jgi:hypothetical protein
MNDDPTIFIDHIGLARWGAVCSCGWLSLRARTKRSCRLLAIQHGFDHRTGQLATR